MLVSHTTKNNHDRTLLIRNNLADRAENAIPKPDNHVQLLIMQAALAYSIEKGGLSVPRVTIEKAMRKTPQQMTMRKPGCDARTT